MLLRSNSTKRPMHCESNEAVQFNYAEGLTKTRRLPKISSEAGRKMICGELKLFLSKNRIDSSILYEVQHNKAVAAIALAKRRAYIMILLMMLL